ncbi:hypothetical protein B0T22DRAFT_463218 [Podospora appendiculata]|uniref:Uncharacterized protein n=1 Tax=Podospora appendiculata TaxID=314037 RepID=A0AAE0XCR7_9PEZI|nr:hypothetical protein B0T22DRAFT_463218 [Podospora appendiculata]
MEYRDQDYAVMIIGIGTVAGSASHLTEADPTARTPRHLPVRKASAGQGFRCAAYSFAMAKRLSRHGTGRLRVPDGLTRECVLLGKVWEGRRAIHTFQIRHRGLRSCDGASYWEGIGETARQTTLSKHGETSTIFHGDTDHMFATVVSTTCLTRLPPFDRCVGNPDENAIGEAGGGRPRWSQRSAESPNCPTRKVWYLYEGSGAPLRQLNQGRGLPREGQE